MANDLLIAYVFSLVFFGLPGLAVAGIGWWLSKRVKNRWGRAGVRGALLSIAFVPSSYGHAGLAPAILAVFYPPTATGTTDWAAIEALAAGWLAAFGIIAWFERSAPDPASAQA